MSALEKLNSGLLMTLSFSLLLLLDKFTLWSFKKWLALNVMITGIYDLLLKTFDVNALDHLPSGSALNSCLLQHAFRFTVDAFRIGNDWRGMIVKIIYFQLKLKVCKALAGSSKALSSLILEFYDVHVKLHIVVDIPIHSFYFVQVGTYLFWCKYLRTW